MKAKWLYSFLIFFLTALLSKGQNACFTLDVARGCAPLTVTAHDCSGETNIGYLFGEGNYNIYNPADYGIDSVYTFNTAGIYTIYQLVPPGGNQIDSIQVEILPSPPPEFDVSLCADTSANVLVPDPQYEEYFVDFGDGFIDTVVTGQLINHKYSSPGSYNITVTGNYVPGDCGGSATRSITLITELIRPLIANINQDSSNSVLIRFSSQTNVWYEIMISKDDTNGFASVDSILSVGSNTSIRTAISVGDQFCYQIRAFDLCGNQNYSVPMCVVIPQVTANNNFNAISWKKYGSGSFVQFDLYKDSVLFGTYTADMDHSFKDSATVCGIYNCYSLRTTLSGGQYARSKDSCVVGISSVIQDTLYIKSTFNENNDVILVWAPPVALYDNFHVYRSGSFLSSTKDTIANTGSIHDCYSVKFSDLCANTSENSNLTCPIYLSSTVNIDDPNYVFLEWTQYKGWSNTPEKYMLQILDDNYNILMEKDMQINTSFNDTIDYSFNQQNYHYRIMGLESSPGRDTSYSNIKSVEVVNSLFIPNTFSPNGDGKNDLFRVHSRFAQSIIINIFDRWSNLVFQTTNLNEGWDGNYENGMLAPAGVYSYYVQITDQNGKVQERKWTLTLIR